MPSAWPSSRRALVLLTVVLVVVAVACVRVRAQQCAQHVSCLSCIQRASCGWCASSGTCLAGFESGPSNATCASWRYLVCASCEDATACEACVAESGCGWCAHACVAGSSSGSTLCAGASNASAYYYGTCTQTAAETAAASAFAMALGLYIALPAGVLLLVAIVVVACRVCCCGSRRAARRSESADGAAGAGASSPVHPLDSRYGRARTAAPGAWMNDPGDDDDGSLHSSAPAEFNPLDMDDGASDRAAARWRQPANAAAGRRNHRAGGGAPGSAPAHVPGSPYAHAAPPGTPDGVDAPLEELANAYGYFYVQTPADGTPVHARQQPFPAPPAQVPVPTQPVVSAGLYTLPHARSIGRSPTGMRVAAYPPTVAPAPGRGRT